MYMIRMKLVCKLCFINSYQNFNCCTCIIRTRLHILVLFGDRIFQQPWNHVRSAVHAKLMIEFFLLPSWLRGTAQTNMGPMWIWIWPMITCPNGQLLSWVNYGGPSGQLLSWSIKVAQVLQFGPNTKSEFGFVTSSYHLARISRTQTW